MHAGGWSSDPMVNTPISTALGHQSNPRLTSDGAGGAIIVWGDDRNNPTAADVYAQRVDATGNVLWAADGVPIYTLGMGGGFFLELVSDGAGGAIITWQDERSDSGDIYAQRIDTTGNVLWAPDGVPISTAGGIQRAPQLVSDGAGGAIIAWDDNRNSNFPNSIAFDDVYAQRIDATGNVLWAADGVPISTAGIGVNDSPSRTQLVSDGAGGAIIAWQDHRVLRNPDIYAQRVNGNGDVLWTIDGVVVSSTVIVQGDVTEFNPQLVSDGAGGAIITWTRQANTSRVYAQRIDTNGNVRWTVGGKAVSGGPGNSGGGRLVRDGAGGAIMIWGNDGNDPLGEIYTQRIDANGTFLWTPGGVPISTAPGALGPKGNPRPISDGAGGAVIVWDDRRNDPTTATDIYAQRVDATGNVLWPADVPISTAVGKQRDHQLVSDGAGGAIITWTDLRSGSLDFNIYAQNVNMDGTLGIGDVVELDIWYIEVNQAVQRIDPVNLTNQVPVIPDYS